MVQILMVVSLVELGVLCALATIFVIGYHRHSRGAWRTIPEGRHLMRFTAALAVTFGLTLGFALLGPTMPLAVALGIQVVVFGVLIFELANRLRLMLSGNGHGRKDSS